MASHDKIARFLQGLFSALNVADPLLFAESPGDKHGTDFIVYFGAWVCIAFGVAIILAVILKASRYAAAQACSWIYMVGPWSKASELEQREKVSELELRERASRLELRERAVELKEVLNARQAQALALDIDIGVTKRVLEILKDSVSIEEDRASELEKKKDLLSEEFLEALG
ncbi:hypothetical protein F5878DRAFT_665940 [Lentinula raphanica]|uniref:Uncharacterized protein n=1 Tax=Lentinula raphanica TaxID=153919 RepID=A0AA38NYQ5_9AGAR|nr:hypothetical protein F5878DRAFT_665940 [Lentinula raphanica]